MKKLYLVTCLLTALSLSAPVLSGSKILINNEGLYPEGISYDAQGKRFYVSSVARGEVWKVNQAGEAELFAKDDAFASTIGLKVDEKHNRLLVCVSDPGVGQSSKEATRGKLAGLAVYDLTSKEKIAYYDLAPVDDNKGHFANDVTVDDEGNIYVTDSFSPAIYKIDSTGSIRTLVTNPKWEVAQGKFGLNGIVYHPDRFLIVAHYATGKLYKVDLDNPNEFEEIHMAQTSIKWKATGLDGLLLLDNATLVAVNNDSSGRENGNFVMRLTSKDGWNNASVDRVMATSNTFPTTLTKIDTDIFVMHAKLATLFTGKEAPEKTFAIEQVLFSDVE